MGRLSLPVAKLGHIDSIPADRDVVFLHFVDQLLFQVSPLSPIRGTRSMVSHHQIKTIAIIQHSHVEGRRDRPTG